MSSAIYYFDESLQIFEQGLHFGQVEVDVCRAVVSRHKEIQVRPLGHVARSYEGCAEIYVRLFDKQERPLGV